MRKRASKNVEPFCKKGADALKDKDFNVALKNFTQALKIEPENEVALNGKFDALIRLGTSALTSNDTMLAMMYFERAHEVIPSDMPTVNRLANLRYELYSKEHPQEKFTAPTTPYAINRIISSGGGIKGIGFYGSFEFLFSNYVDRRKLVALGGTSAGVFGSLVVAFGYSLKEMKAELEQLQFTDLMQGEFREKFLYLLKNRKNIEKMTKGFGADFKRLTNVKRNPSGAISAGSSLAKEASSINLKVISEGLSLLSKDQFGLFSGDYFREKVLERLIQQKTGIAYCTFRELHELHLKDPETYKDLYLTGTNVSRQEVQVFSHETTPDDIISDATFISSCFPGFFIYHTRHLKIQGERREHNSKDVFIDGGALDNYPLWMFDREKYLPYGNPESNKVVQNPHVLGLRLVSSERVLAYTTDEALPPLDKPRDVLNYFFQILLTMRKKEESDHKKNFESWRTIYIDNLGIPTTQFDLDPRKQMALIQKGTLAVSEQFLTLEYKQGHVKEHHDIWTAIKLGNSEAVEKWLLRGFRLDSRDQDGYSVLDVAYKNKQTPIVVFLVMHGALLTAYPKKISDILHSLLNNVAIDIQRLASSLKQFDTHHGINLEVQVEHSPFSND